MKNALNTLYKELTNAGLKSEATKVKLIVETKKEENLVKVSTTIPEDQLPDLIEFYEKNGIDYDYVMQ